MQNNIAIAASLENRRNCTIGAPRQNFHLDNATLSIGLSEDKDLVSTRFLYGITKLINTVWRNEFNHGWRL